jgi:proline iminopeptidase
VVTSSPQTMVTIAGVPTFVRRVGTGPPVLVLHGGPGFDHAYLQAPLRTLADRRTLVFYDQPGSGRSTPAGDVNAALTFRHCAAFVDEVVGEGRLGLIAHSWGCLVALGARAAGMQRHTFDEGLLVTPVPVSRARYDAASRNLFAGIPADVVERYSALASKGANHEIVALLLPYYFAKPVPPAEVELNINIKTFLGVTNSLGAFDLSQHLPLFKRCHALTTGCDFSTPELVDDLLSVVAERHVVPDAGHFPSHESPDEFDAVLRHAFPRAQE